MTICFIKASAGPDRRRKSWFHSAETTTEKSWIKKQTFSSLRPRSHIYMYTNTIVLCEVHQVGGEVRFLSNTLVLLSWLFHISRHKFVSKWTWNTFRGVDCKPGLTAGFFFIRRRMWPQLEIGRAGRLVGVLVLWGGERRAKISK